MKMAEANYLVIVGSGNLAKVFAEKVEDFAQKEYQLKLHPISFDGSLPVKNSSSIKTLKDLPLKHSLFLHLGSGRQLDEALKFCDVNKIPFIQASSGQTVNLSSPIYFPYIEAPNLSLPIIKLLWLLNKKPGLFKNSTISIEESHQSSKTTVPATAQKFADLLKSSKENIKSIRDPKIQSQDWKIPEKFLDGHAMHRISIQGQGAEIFLETKIFGRETYLFGVLEILSIKSKLEPKKYSIEDLLGSHLL
ncbi:MAG: hypothetical protein J0L93_08140 [Deltaproteobacteria bacterium]|nr:hypothetical protein [Deltaproteobacteria bacterium]